MFWAAVLCLAILGKAAKGNWEDGSDDPTYSNLGFYVRNTTCNDEESQCMDCLTIPAFGFTFLHTFEYSESPSKFLFTAGMGQREWRMLQVQDDRFGPFRFCMETEDPLIGEPGHQTPVVLICIDNIFSGISVPAECPRPLAVVTLTCYRGDERLTGEQVLYCMPLE